MKFYSEELKQLFESQEECEKAESEALEAKKRAEEEKEKLPKELQERVIDVLRQDPRAAYNKKPDYVYGMSFAGYDIRFVVEQEILTVKQVVPLSSKDYKKVK